MHINCKMKKLTLFFLLVIVGFLTVFGQEIPKTKNVRLNKNIHFKITEPLVIKITNYLFETPINKNNNNRNEVGQFLIKWMNGTQDYTFYLAEKETNFFNTDADLMLMYMAAITKFVLDNKNIRDQKEIVYGTMQLVLPYLNQQSDKKCWSKELWQLNDAQQNGKLKEYLEF